MPKFREHRLTWLYLVAAACFDVIALALHWEVRRNVLSIVLMGVLFGQMVAAGAWLIVGRTHRLVRGAAFLAFLAAMTSLIALMGRPVGDLTIEEWGRLFAAVAVVSACATLGAALVVLVRSRAAAYRRSAGQSKLKIPLIEFFGWTALVAFGSLALRAAHFEHLGQDLATLALVVFGGVCGGIVMALFFVNSERIASRQYVIAAAASILYFSWAFGENRSREPEITWSYLVAFLFVGGLLLVGALDRRRQAALAEGARADVAASDVTPGEAGTKEALNAFAAEDDAAAGA